MKQTCLLFALLAFAFSVMAFFSKQGAIAAEGALALVGICTTLIVGVSVVDTMTIQRMQKDIAELPKLKKDLSNLKNENKNVFFKSRLINLIMI